MGKVSNCFSSKSTYFERKVQSRTVGNGAASHCLTVLAPQNCILYSLILVKIKIAIEIQNNTKILCRV
jgi:hypothetical protein